MEKINQNPVILVIIIGFFVLFSCGDSEEEHSTKNKTEFESNVDNIEAIEQDLLQENRAQVYVIEKKAVVFFTVSKKEMLELMNEIGDSYRWETEALFNDFIKQANTMQSLLKKHNIPCFLSTSKKFEIKLNSGKIVSFDREEKDQILGEIITDGVQKPLVEYGMYSTKELVKLIESFYKIGNLGYIPPPDSIKTVNDKDSVPY